MSQTSSDRLERLFGERGQDKGVIVRATEEQIRELQRCNVEMAD